MSAILKKLALSLVLWLPFSAGAIASVFTSFWAIWAEENTYGKNVLRAMDKTLASVLGFGGFFTLSAECGVATTAPWTWLRKLLDTIQPGHCEGAAKNEGLTAQ
ncbi:MAG: hypothetical protein Q7U97_06695 [Rhodocyclaceae bacterium]|nr:hypothetical protein [Rhodocyclaceae bacterium]